MNLLIVPFIETTIPVGLEENRFGVAHHVLMARGEHKNQKTHWSIEILAVNGIWYGASDALTNMGGYGVPCTRQNTPFTNAEDCIDYHYKRVCEFFKREGKGIPPKPSLKDFKEAYLYNHET